MFYKPEEGHGLKNNPFNAIITPRPIGWISTRDKKSIDNIAPYSFFNAVAYVPPQVMFASTGDKPDRDGTKESPNFDETSKVASISNCPVIISGGVSSINDVKKAKNMENIEGIIVGKAIYDGDIKLEELVKEDA